MKIVPTQDGMCIVLSQMEQQGVVNATKSADVPKLTPRGLLEALAQRYSANFTQDITDLVNDLEDDHATV